MEYDILKPWRTLDPWQKEYIDTKGNCYLICGRQSGKTTAASIKFGTLAVKEKNRCILMIAETEKQAYNLFFKTLMFLEAVYPKSVNRRAKFKPTKHEINLTNGAKIMCYAAGLSGSGLRTYTLTNLVIDEAAPMSREIFVSTMPMLSVTGGSMDIMSTPRGKQGFFYDCSKRDDFKKFYISAEDCPRHKKDFLENQKKMMTKLEYAQEYLALFLDDLKRFFDDEWIKKTCTMQRAPAVPGRRYFLGVDVGHMGEDASTFEIIEKVDKENFRQVENIVTNKKRLTETIELIKELNRDWKFKKIYIDDGGLGVGVFDHLLDFPETRRKVVAINNARRSLDKDGKRQHKLMKEDLYTNLLRLGERGDIKLLADDEVIASLKSVQQEWVVKEGEYSRWRIWGNNTHIVEGIIRGAWSSKDKTLNIWVR